MGEARAAVLVAACMALPVDVGAAKTIWVRIEGGSSGSHADNGRRPVRERQLPHQHRRLEGEPGGVHAPDNTQLGDGNADDRPGREPRRATTAVTAPYDDLDRRQTRTGGRDSRQRRTTVAAVVG